MDIAAVNQVLITGKDESGPAFDSAVKNIGRVDAAAKGMGVQFQVASDALKSLGEGNTLGALEGPLHAIGGAAGAASLAFLGVAAGLLAVLKSTAESTNALRIQAAQAGTNVQEFQKLAIISQLVGNDQAILSRTLSKLNEDMALAADVTSKTGYAFNQLGVQIKDNNGNYRDTGVVFQDLLEKVTNLKDEQSKIAALTDIFGAKQARLMLPMLDEMKTKYGEMSAFAEEVGAIKTPRLVAESKIWHEEVTKIGLMWEGIQNTITLIAIPGLTNMAAKTTDLAPALSNIERAMERFSETVGKTAFGKDFMRVFDFLSTMNPVSMVWKLVSALGASDPSNAPAFGVGGRPNAYSQMGIPEGPGGPGDASTYIPFAAKVAGKGPDLAELDKLRGMIVTLNAETQKYDDALNHVTSTSLALNKVTDEYANRLITLAESGKFMTATEDALWNSVMKSAIATDAARVKADGYKTALKEWEEQAKAIQSAQDAFNNLLVKAAQQMQAYTDKISDQVGKSDLERESIGKTAAEITLMTVARQFDIDARKLEEQYMKDFPLASQAERDAIRATADAAKQVALERLADNQKVQDSFSTGWAKAMASYEDGLTGAKTAQTSFNSLTSSMETLFVGFANHATNAWQTFKNSILQAIEQIGAKLVTSGIMSLLGIGGSSGSVGGITSLFSGGGGSPGSGLFSGLFGDLPSFGTALSNVSGGFSTFTSLLTDGMGIMDAAGISVAGLGSSFAALLGPIGIVAAIAIPLLSSLFSKGGGPKQAGQAGLDYYTSETSPEANAIIKSTVDALGTSYTSMLAAYGGKGTASFGLGYDKDPQGTAQNRISSTATVGGQNVYSTRDVNVGRDDATLQAGLTLEAQRVVLAALKASDLPADIAKLFSTIDVPTASAADITAIEKTAAVYKLINDTLSTLPADVQKHFTDMLDGTQKTADAVLVVTSIIRTFGDAIVGIGPKLEALDPASLIAFVDALGGAAAATASFAYLGQNFLTTADRLTQSTKTLNVDFTNLGLTIPTTHQQFLDLLNSFDLTTDAGRQMYASVLALAPLFVTVHGTADQATTSINGVSVALSSIAQSADAFFKANFYTTAEQAAKKYADELKQVNDASIALGITIPTSVEGFRALIEGIDTSTDAGKKLYAALIVLAPAVFDLSGAAATAATNVTNLTNSISDMGAGAIDARQRIQQTADTFLSQVAGVANQLGSASVGDKLALQVNLIGKKILAINDQVAAFRDRGDEFGAETLLIELGIITQANTKLVAQLAEFTTLKAQYGDAIAGQLIDLENWYADQQTALAGNVQALGALGQIYNDKWAAIIAGTSSGVSNTISALQKIADYLKSLQISTISPLTPLQKLGTAGSAFEADYAKAAGGDATALGNITADADAYLKLARDAYASSQTYTDIFNKVTQELATLAGTDTSGQPRQVVSDPAWPGLAAALPSNGSRLASQADITAQTASIIDALAAHADAGTADAGTITTAVQRGAVLVADSVGSGTR